MWKIITLTCALLILSALFFSAEIFAVDQCWESRLSSSGNHPDVGKKIGVDSQGYIYVVAEWHNGANLDIKLIKYNPATGDTVWTRVYNGGGEDSARALAIYGSGIYITGASYNEAVDNFDFVTMRYSNLGTLVWVTRTNQGYNEEAWAIAVNSDGVYVSGEAESAGQDDVLTVKYRISDGYTFWTERYDNTLWDYAVAMCLDNDSNVYITGCGYYGALRVTDYLTLSYSPSGTQRWVKWYNGGTADYAWDIAYDPTGYVWVTGETGSVYKDYTTVKYRCSDGNEMYSASHDGSVNRDDMAYAVVCDNLGNAYVTGRSVVDLMYQASCMTTIKYGPTCNVLWTKEVCPAASTTGIGHDICLDGLGNCYVVGEVDYSYYTTDYQVVSYLCSNGDERWRYHYDGLDHNPDAGRAIVAPKLDTVYVTGGSISDATGSDVVTLKLCAPVRIDVNDPNGGEQWYAGSKHWILWNPTGVTGNVVIAYRTSAGGTWDTIATVPVTPAAYLWTIPATLSENCRARVSSVTNPSVFDTSDACFTIYKFLPDRDGWSFVNNEQNMWPPSCWVDYDSGHYDGISYADYPLIGMIVADSAYPSWPLFVKAFGEDDCIIRRGLPPVVNRFRYAALMYWMVFAAKWDDWPSPEKVDG